MRRAGHCAAHGAHAVMARSLLARSISLALHSGLTLSEMQRALADGFAVGAARSGMSGSLGLRNAAMQNAT